jgi:hypothetical protein
MSKAEAYARAWRKLCEGTLTTADRGSICVLALCVYSVDWEPIVREENARIEMRGDF